MVPGFESRIFVLSHNHTNRQFFLVRKIPRRNLNFSQITELFANILEISLTNSDTFDDHLSYKTFFLSSTFFNPRDNRGLRFGTSTSPPTPD
jgi:hypothetical protein